MSITASSLYRDTGNFFRHQFFTILLLALLTAFISTILRHALIPSPEQLSIFNMNEQSTPSGNVFELIQNMTQEQRLMLLRISAANSFASLASNTLLLGGMLFLIPIASAGQRVSALRAIGASAPLLPKLLLMVFLISFLVQLGFAVMVIPGVVLTILLSLSPILMVSGKMGILNAMRSSFRLVWQNMRLVAPVVVLWMIAKISLLLLATHAVDLPVNMTIILQSVVSNLISALLIIYLSRLVMLLL
ncbi:YciC family protein [Enterobacteriaceae bacterium LUAb1]